MIYSAHLGLELALESPALRDCVLYSALEQSLIPLEAVELRIDLALQSIKLCFLGREIALKGSDICARLLD